MNKYFIVFEKGGIYGKKIVESVSTKAAKKSLAIVLGGKVRIKSITKTV